MLKKVHDSNFDPYGRAAKQAGLAMLNQVATADRQHGHRRGDDPRRTQAAAAFMHVTPVLFMVQHLPARAAPRHSASGCGVRKGFSFAEAAFSRIEGRPLTGG
ncbi:MAG: hypothetical protein ACREXP_20225 [Steroidobacteraceae bacterium]